MEEFKDDPHLFKKSCHYFYLEFEKMVGGDGPKVPSIMRALLAYYLQQKVL
jgi:hypothetical protein